MKNTLIIIMLMAMYCFSSCGTNKVSEPITSSDAVITASAPPKKDSSWIRSDGTHCRTEELRAYVAGEFKDIDGVYCFRKDTVAIGNVKVVLYKEWTEPATAALPPPAEIVEVYDPKTRKSISSLRHSFSF